MKRAALWLLIAACHHAAPALQPRPPAPQPPPPAPPTVRAATLGGNVLLVATGLNAERDALTAADVKAGYCGGTIAVLAPVAPVADAYFACAHPGEPVATLDAFLPGAKTSLIVTDLDHVGPRWKTLTIDGRQAFLDAATYPLRVGGADVAPHLTHFILTGVTAITRAAGAQIDGKGIAWYTQNLRAEFAHAQYVHISNEVSLKDDCTYPVSGTYTFCSKPRDFQALLDLHANVIELTGNHMRDFGDEPFKKTLDWYAAHDMKTFGGGRDPKAAAEPIVLALADGKKLGIAGFNELCPLKECAIKPGEVGANGPYSPEKGKAAIAKLRAAGADYVMVTVQYKEWDSAQPTAAQTTIGHQLIDDGADFVYGSQAHQLQVVEFYRGKPIFHGLGNLLFDQIHRIGVRQAFFLHEFFYAGKLAAAIPVFTFMSDERQPTLATPAQAAEMKQIVYEDARLYTP